MPANDALAGGFLSKREAQAFPLTPSAEQSGTVATTRYATG